MVFERSDYFSALQNGYGRLQAAGVFCVQMMRLVIPIAYLHLFSPCFMYKLQFTLEVITYLCFCTFHPVKITRKFYRGATAQCREQPSGNAASHCLTDNRGFYTFSNTLRCRDSVYTSEVNIWCLKPSRAFPLILSPALGH